MRPTKHWHLFRVDVLRFLKNIVFHCISVSSKIYIFFVPSIFAHTSFLIFSLHESSHLSCKCSHRSQNLIQKELFDPLWLQLLVWASEEKLIYHPLLSVSCCKCVGLSGHTVSDTHVCCCNLRIFFGKFQVSCSYLLCRNMTLEKEIFPAATDSRFIRAVSLRTGWDKSRNS